MEYTVKGKFSFTGEHIGTQVMRSNEKYAVYKLDDGRYLLLYDNGTDHGFRNSREEMIRLLWTVNRLYLPDRLIQKLGGLTSVDKSKLPKRTFWQRLFGNYEKTPEEIALDNMKRREDMIQAEIERRV